MPRMKRPPPRGVPVVEVRLRPAVARCPRCGSRNNPRHSNAPLKRLNGLLCDYEVHSARYYCKRCEKHFTLVAEQNAKYRSQTYADETVDEALRLVGKNGRLTAAMKHIQERYGIRLAQSLLSDWAARESARELEQAKKEKAYGTGLELPRVRQGELAARF